MARTSKPTRVLIVDDEPTIRGILAEALRDEGYEVTEAENGEAGLRQLKRRVPHAILLDMMMPGMNGWVFMVACQTDARLARIPIIVLSAVRSALEDAERLGASAALAKPFDLEEVLLALRSVLTNPARVRPDVGATHSGSQSAPFIQVPGSATNRPLRPETVPSIAPLRSIRGDSPAP